MALAVFALTLRVLLASGPAQAPAASHADASSQETSYAATPEALRPYHGVREVFWRYFETPPVFLGPGRGDPPPENLDTFKLGLFAPIEGRGEIEIGGALERGVRLALEESNAQGGFRGRIPYELVTRNDAAIWGDSSNTIVDLAYREKVWAILGSVDAASTHVAIRVALKAEIPMVNTACTDPTLTETAIPWIVRCYPDDRQHGYLLARLVYQEHGFRNVAVLRSNDKYGRMGIKEFADAARRLGRPLVLEARFVPGSTGFDPQLARIRESGADAIVLWGGSADCGRIVARLRELGMDQPVFGNDRLVTGSFLAAAGRAAEGVVATSPLDPDCRAAAWLDFRRRFEARFGREPDGFAAFSYDGARMLLAAIERAGPNRVRILDELAAIKEFPGTLGLIRLDPTLNHVGRLYALQVHDGRFTRIPEK